MSTLSLEVNSSDSNDFVKSSTQNSLRKLVKDCLNKNSLKCAEFYADKLVTLDGGLENDVYTLGLIYHRLGQNHRMIHLFQRRKFLADPQQELVFGKAPTKLAMHPRFLLLAMEGLYQAKSYEEGLKLTSYINDNDAYEIIKSSCKDSMSDEDPYEIDHCSSLCLVRGKIWEALDHKDYAIRWYRRALKHDAKNFEAFSRLIERRMIPHSEELNLLDTLEHALSGLQDTEWLYTFYQSMLEQYDYGLRKKESPQCGIQQKFEKWDLQDNEHVKILQAHTYYNLNSFDQCHHITSKIIQNSPFNEEVLAPHICSLVELKKKADLHYLAHQLASCYPERPISWFAVGAYYYLVRKYDVARRHFNKATDIDQHFAPAWIGFGHSFGYQDACDQAVAAYRTANRLFPGSHLPLVCIGMEYVRTQNLPLAQLYFERAKHICLYDPLIYNELGIIAYKMCHYDEAASLLDCALKYCSSISSEMEQPILYNLGHALRKLEKYQRAIITYKQALNLDPKNPKILTSIAFTHLLKGEYEEAIEYCHKSLALLSTDSFAVDVLHHALEDHAKSLGIRSQKGTR